MRLTIRALGLALLDLQFQRDTEEGQAPEPVYGPPFGFSGSGSGHIERSEQAEWETEA